MPSRQPTNNPLTLATVFNSELIAGAHSFFGIGALQVAPLPLPLLEEVVTCYEDDYYYSATERNPTTADYS